MQTLSLTGTIDETGHLRLDVPTQLPPGRVELVLVINAASTSSDRSKAYDFSDLSGALTWKGDAVTMQRQLRDEW